MKKIVYILPLFIICSKVSGADIRIEDGNIVTNSYTIVSTSMPTVSYVAVTSDEQSVIDDLNSIGKRWERDAAITEIKNRLSSSYLIKQIILNRQEIESGTKASSADGIDVSVDTTTAYNNIKKYKTQLQNVSPSSILK